MSDIPLLSGPQNVFDVVDRTNKLVNQINADFDVQAAKSTVTDVQATGTVTLTFTATFTQGNEVDADNWKQVNNQDYIVPAGKAGHYIICCSYQTSAVDANETLQCRIVVNGVEIATDTDLSAIAGGRDVSASMGIALSEGDIVKFMGFANDPQTVAFLRISISQIS